MKRLSKTGIKFKITMIIIISIAIITAAISYVTYSTYKNLLKKNFIESTASNLQTVIKNIEIYIDEITRLATWCSINSQVISYIENAPDKINNTQILNTYYRVKEEVLNSTAGRYVDRLIISNDDNALIQITNDTKLGNINDGLVVRSIEYFDELLNEKKIKWIGIKDDPFVDSKESDVIPIIRPIYNNYSICGWIYISINTNIIKDYLKAYDSNDDSYIYITIGDKKYVYSNGDLIEDSTQFNIINKNKYKRNNIVSYDFKDNSDELTLVYNKSSIEGWGIGKVFKNNNKMLIEAKSFLPVFLLIVILLFSLGIILTYIFNSIINNPIRKINEKILKIAGGDFSYAPEIEGDNEIGSIGRGINILSKELLNLINTMILEEKNKKDLEFKMLQSQINPHFLYNTLNSIKWMATIQNATGIPEMTTSLARLLKNISKGTDELISLKEEIELLNEYITIQQYRYGGGITVDYDVKLEELYSCKIIKFTLQPIVENAIFHGIEPKGNKGKISIVVSKISSEKISVEIIDDGVGITDVKIKEILGENPIKNNKSFNNIGIKNVDDRIKLTFGNEYGLTITSEINKYTNMKITIPY